jgi:hypothetical protein
MPALSNPKHEEFAQQLYLGISLGRTNGDSYVAAGYRGHDRNTRDAGASRLRHRIIARVQELQAQAARAKRVTVESVISELDEARDIAADQKQASAMVNASTAKAKIAGLMVERSEVGEPGDFSGARSLRDLAFRLLEDANPGTAVTEAMVEEGTKELERHIETIQRIASPPESAEAKALREQERKKAREKETASYLKAVS